MYDRWPLVSRNALFGTAWRRPVQSVRHCRVDDNGNIRNREAWIDTAVVLTNLNVLLLRRQPGDVTFSTNWSDNRKKFYIFLGRFFFLCRKVVLCKLASYIWHTSTLSKKIDIPATNGHRIVHPCRITCSYSKEVHQRGCQQDAPYRSLPWKFRFQRDVFLEFVDISNAIFMTEGIT